MRHYITAVSWWTWERITFSLTASALLALAALTHL